MHDQEKKAVTITVDAAKSRGALNRIWRSIGYDEMNWTYTPIGSRIFREIAALHDGPYWVRNHNIFSSGNLRSAPYEASTNCVFVDPDGKVGYDWSTVDRVYDVFVENGCKPMVELDFMPCELSASPAVVRKNEISSDGRYKSGRYTPRNYDMWRDLTRSFALHVIDRYGIDEVRTWYFSSWNEPDLPIWIDIPDDDGLDPVEHERLRRTEFFKVHDYAIDGILQADDTLRVGGPDLAFRIDFLEDFLAHCESGTNYANGKTGSRLDFLSLHTKGTGLKNGRVLAPDYDSVVRRALMAYLGVIRRFPSLCDLPLLLNEWDIDVWSPGGIHDCPDFFYRNTSYFPTFLAREVKGLLDFCERERVNLELITQWTFYYHGFRCFEGTRSLLDPIGIRKPLFNGFELLSRLGDERVVLRSDDQTVDVAPGESVGRGGQRRPVDGEDEKALGPALAVSPYPRVDGLASRSSEGVQVLVWNQAADPRATDVRDVTVRVDGLTGWTAARVTEYRVDDDHSNAHTAWQELGAPDWPTAEQVNIVRQREKLETIRDDESVAVVTGVAEVRLRLPMHGLALIELRRERA